MTNRILQDSGWLDHPGGLTRTLRFELPATTEDVHDVVFSSGPVDNFTAVANGSEVSLVATLDPLPPPQPKPQPRKWWTRMFDYIRDFIRRWFHVLLPYFVALALVPVLVAGPARADILDFVTTTQALTGAAPTLGTQGISLFKSAGKANGYRVIVSAVSGQTVLGGSLLCYYWSYPLLRWMRCDPALDVTLTGGGTRDAVSFDYESMGFGRVYFATNGVAVSGGTTVNVTIEVTYAR